MLFNSIEFFIFLPIVYFLYWYILRNNLKKQNLLLLISSYFFYGWWDWRFLSLILLSSASDFYIGLKIFNSNTYKQKKLFLFISIFLNLTILGFFKYFNFFIDSWINLFKLIGYSKQSPLTLNIILPLGISFYTFQTISYTFDIYYKRVKPTRDIISFAAFVSFFPQLVAGPIERASNLLPKILEPRNFDFDQFIQGLRLILWGMFKKVVVADTLSLEVNSIFTNFDQYNGGVLILGLIYFSFQIYCDFSGYSDIAIGTAKLFGFELMSNFKYPYFSKNIIEFWKRWHISLSTWFRDYVYIPLGGSKNGLKSFILNIIIIFILSGFWHGANWTFIFWGLIHALIYLITSFVSYVMKYFNIREIEKGAFGYFINFINMLTTYTLVMITWVFFRSESLTNSFQYIINLLSNIDLPDTKTESISLVIVILVFDWVHKNNERKPLCFDSLYNFKILGKVKNLKHFTRFITYSLLFWITIIFIFKSNNEFLYFQF